MRKPEPINKHIVCSVCGLDWDRHGASRHGASPSLETCIELLKAELAKPKPQPWIYAQSTTTRPTI